ncbi:SDR family NAD(P)-dependent oxidoreductase [Pontibacillus litoralis]|uniref:Thioester reductase (TE) domain-containing protein n=1 Tax=Pontibacillus litoralis JSM 072002 TaxID=1385512 RepID=A0A0A5G5C3_9BACI|nr:SDR family oxidoreductase [Pontibacillus litoralis]KGX86358.1 hypothetical protein N784_05250 [Pontibacillus litoralis JSM 072002]
MNILLTGATGFVGKQLTIRFMQQGHTVYALARNERKADQLMQAVPLEAQHRLFIIEGDLMKENAGIHEEDIDLLTGEIDTVYHSAAYLSFDNTEREKTFHINVTGTRNMLELAKKIQAPHFNYVSTAYTLGMKPHAKEELHRVDQPFVNAYEESKCHGEHLASQYKDVMNVNIFRPAIIIGDSTTGEAETSFALYGVIRGLSLFKKRMARKQTSQNETFKFLCTAHTSQNFVPVDYVVDVLVAAATAKEANKIYHITNPHPPTNRALFDMVKQKLAFPNIEMVPADYNGALTKEELAFNEPMKVFKPYWSKNVTFDDTNTQALLRKQNMPHLNMDEDMLHRILNGAIKN